MLIVKRRKDIAQIESGEVDFVRDFRIGDSPRSVKYISNADFAVESRREFRWLNCEERLFGGGKFGSNRGVGAWEFEFDICE
jgi:hypothetical protein